MGLFWDDVVVNNRTVVRIPPPIPQTDWKMPDSFPDLSGHGKIAIDVETHDPDLKTKGPGTFRGGYIAGVAVGTEAGFREYYPIAHQGGPNQDKTKVLSWLGEQLKRPGQPKVGAHIIYDLEFLAAAGVKVTGPFYDIQNAEPLLDETQLSYSLENIATRRIGEGKRDEVMAKWLIQAYGAGNIKDNIWRAPPQVVGPYAISDVDLPLRIFATQEKELHEQGLASLFDMESRLVPMLLGMRQRGVRVDVAKAEQLQGVLLQRQKAAEEQIKRISGIEPDIWSAECLARIFDAVGVPYPRTGKTNAPSFRKEWLEQLRIPVAKAIVEARHMDKFRGTFVEGYILNGHINGRIHCQFHQLRSDEGGTVSGRLSSSTPNMQNLPIRDPELGNLIRSIFIAEQDQQWIKLDWSQVEFRLAVHYAALLCLTGARQVVEQYRTDPTTDYHKVTAQLTGLTRSEAKSVNFGIIYGLGVDGLCAQLGVSREEGESILYQYHRKVPFAKSLYNAASNRAASRGEITTLLGRKRRFNMWDKGSNQYFHINDILEQDVALTRGWRRSFTHKALNALLQGSAADIMKKAMVQIAESGVMDVLGAPHLTVHDELDGSLPPTQEAMEALAEMKHIMETCVALEIPLTVDQVIAASWGQT